MPPSLVMTIHKAAIQVDQVSNSVSHNLNYTKVENDVMVPSQSKGGEVQYTQCMFLQGIYIGKIPNNGNKKRGYILQPLNQIPNTIVC